MQPTDPGVAQSVAESLRDFALDYLWQWLAAGGVAALVALRAYMKGTRGPALYLLAGAVLGIGSVVGAIALLAWSRYVFYVVASVGVLAWLVYGAVRVSRREQARLRGHAKGIIDFRKDFQKASTRNVTVAEAYQQSVNDFSAAATGIMLWLAETGQQAQLRELRPAFQKLRTAAMAGRDNTQTLRNTLVGLPNMSQAFNASRAELIESVNMVLAAMESSAAFADDALAHLTPAD